MKKAALLAAGDSTRMMPLSADLPKHLLPVAGKPLIFHTLEGLKQAGIEKILIVYGYQGDQLKAAVNEHDWSPMEISYVYQDERMGTAHAAGYAREFASSDEILMMYGDVMVEPESFQLLITKHRERDYAFTMAVFPVDNPSAYGVIETEDDRIIDIIEKPSPGQTESNLVNAGVFAVGEGLWDAIDKTKPSPRGEYEITDSIMMIARKGGAGVFKLPSWWIDVGKPWDLLAANKAILSDIRGRVDGLVEDGAVLNGDIIVEKGARIRSGAYIQGPVYVGEDCVVGPNCYIRAHTYLVRGVKVGNACEVKNSIIMDGTSIGHLSYVGDSVIGRKVNFGAGTITANLRHDNTDVMVTVKGKRVSSGRRKLGAIIGDYVKTGIGTLLSPGVVLHEDAKTGVGTIVDRDVGPGMLVYPKQPKETIDWRHSE